MSKITIKKIGNPSKHEKDTLRIKRGTINIRLNIIKGKQGEHFIYYAPSLRVSGYGKTEKEAEEFLIVEMETFCEDLLSMTNEERENFLFSIGFKKERFHNKNFSKAYVDDNGVLQGLEQETLEHAILETA